MSQADSAGRWERVEAILGAVLELDEADRGRFLDESCADNPELRREVLSLLAAHDRSGAFDELAADLAPLAARLRAPMALPTTGVAIGRYRVVARVAGGGMGVVYKAVDEQLDRTIALKFLHAHLRADSSASERFRSEAKAVASLEHPNVCTVHEIGETADGQLYLAMPLYEGETLQQRIARGPLPVHTAVGIAVQIARGLAKAHDRRIVHRDIKPSNVFVTSDGVVKILDFGIAKLTDVTLTEPGSGPLGTVAYMSPEQLRGMRVDHRADLWALGVVLYEMLAGTRPFEGVEPLAARAAILQVEPPAPSSKRGDVPAALDRIISRALAKSPDARYASAAALERDLLSLGLTTDLNESVEQAAFGNQPWLRSTSRRLRWIASLAAVLAIAAVVASWWSGSETDRSPVVAASAMSGQSIVVLPFVNMTADAGNEYFSDGITDEIIMQLAGVPSLRVISRTSAMRYKERTASLREIANELRVAHVLEGSVRRDGERVRIAVQLLRANTEETLWSQRYDRQLVDVLTVQEDIAREVGRALEVTLGDQRRAATARGTRDPEAYALFLHGRYHWQKRTKEGHDRAVAYFRDAIERDSTYADAYAGLAATYLTGYAQYVPGFIDNESETYAKLKWAAERAVALDDNSALAHRAMANLRWWERDWRGAERELLRTLELNPGDEQAHNWYGALLGLTGRIDDAVRESRRAYELDPFNITGSNNYADQLLLAREYDLAIALNRKALEINSSHPFSRRSIGILYALKSMYAEAERELRHVVDSAPHIPDFKADLAYAVALSGRQDEARRLLREVKLLGDGPRKRDAAYSIGRAHVALGEADSAFAWFDRADWRWPHRGNRYDPALDPLRTDPRFALLADRVDREMRMR